MATITQIDSARRNGRLSKGPVTAAGKARSSRNALKHGMHSSAVVLNNERGDIYDEVLAGYLAEYKPANRREHDLVEAIVEARWRLNRILTIETAALDYEIDKQRTTLTGAEKAAKMDEGTRAALAFTALAESGATLSLLSRHEGRLRRAIERTHDRLSEMQSARKSKNCENEPDLAA
jgi:hypothetical protein